VERAVAIARAALASGVVEGGGSALARVSRSVAREFRGGEHEVGAVALANALAAPMETIIRQSGQEPGPLLHSMTDHDDVFDVRSGSWVSARDTGLADPLAVVEGALEVAVSTALMMLSTDVLMGG
jgi:chaperonin GroEL